jgi:transcriptional regulator with PAS, ATPase and Fis domain
MNTTNHQNESDTFAVQLRTVIPAIVTQTSSSRKTIDEKHFHHITCSDMKHKMSYVKNRRSPQKVIKKKRKKIRKLWNESDMERGIDMVLREGKSCRGAAKICNIPRSTLYTRLQKEKSLVMA